MSRSRTGLTRIATLTMFCTLCSSCASFPHPHTAVMAGYTKSFAHPTFRLVDERPPEERDSRWLSLLITSCNYGVRQFGDQATSPSRIVLLKQDIEASVGPQLAHQTLILTHYVIDLNTAAVFRNNVYGQHPGVVSGLMKRSGTRCSRRQMEGGWFSPDEISTPYPPVIVDIAVTWNGRRYQAHGVESSSKPVTWLRPGFPPVSAAIFGAMRKATNQLVAELRKN